VDSKPEAATIAPSPKRVVAGAAEEPVANVTAEALVVLAQGKENVVAGTAVDTVATRADERRVAPVISEEEVIVWVAEEHFVTVDAVGGSILVFIEEQVVVVQLPKRYHHPLSCWRRRGKGSAILTMYGSAENSIVPDITSD